MISDSKELPLISIVMPCFNCVDYIERSIRSIVEQDYPNIELFIKDGGSEDGTVEIIKYYARKYPKVISWVSSKDKGQADAIKFGMKQLKGAVLSFLNADDVYKKNSLMKVGQYFLNHPEIMWAYGKGDIISPDDKKIRSFITVYKNLWLWHFSYTNLLILNYISQMSCFWRREAAKEVGEFDESQFYVMDYDYWLRLGKKFKAGVIPAYLGSFRIVAKSKSSKGFVQQFKDEYSVAGRYTQNPTILSLHRLHYNVVVLIYSIFKMFNSVSGNFYTNE